MAKSSDKKAGKNMTVRLCAGQDIVCGGNGTLSGFSIRNGSRADIGNLKKLWKSCFDDGDSYIDGFFHTFFNEEDILLTEEEGMLAGASFFLPGKIYLENGWQDIRYVYALATFEQFRGRGVAGSLLRYAFRHYETPLIAEPAEEGLVAGFYEPLGFCSSFYLSHTSMRMKPQTETSAAVAQFCRNDGNSGGAAVQTEKHTESVLYAAEITDAAQIRIPEAESGSSGNEAAETAYDKKRPAERNPDTNKDSAMDSEKVKDPGRAAGNKAESDVEPWCERRGGSDETHMYDRPDDQKGYETLYVCGERWSLQPAEATVYDRVRKQCFRGPGYVSWPAGHAAFAIHEHRQSRGEAYFIRRPGREDLLLYYIEGQRIVVTETTLEPEDVAAFFQIRLPGFSGQLEIHGRCVPDRQGQPETDKPHTAVRLTGMLYGLPAVNGYLNLTLD